MNIRKNISLIVGIAIPIIMIGVVALSIYIPKLNAPKPQYDFLYITGNYSYPEKYNYFVEGETIKRLDQTTVYPKESIIPPTFSDATIYYFDMAKNESREISFEDAQKLRLDSKNKSPDGFEIVSGNSSGSYFPFFPEQDYSTKYVRGHNSATKLNVQTNGNFYDFRFMGWVKK